MERTCQRVQKFFIPRQFSNKSKRDSIRANKIKRYNEEFDPGSG
jgi:hypothetical protein